MEVGSGQGLSWPNSAHSKFRELPSVSGGAPGEASVGCGSLEEQVH